MRNTRWFAITLAAGLAFGGLTVSQAHGADAGFAAHQQILEHVKEKLGLTDEQITKVHEALHGERETLTTLITRLHSARVTLREAIHSTDGTESAIRDASAKVSAVEADLAIERHKLYGKINPILTEDQRTKVKEYLGQLDEFVDGAIRRMGEHLAGQ